MTAVPESKDATELGYDDERTEAADEYPHGARLAAIVMSLMLGMFLVALDNVSYTRRCRAIT
jgi:hypothetical protein